MEDQDIVTLKGYKAAVKLKENNPPLTMNLRRYQFTCYLWS